MENAGKMCWLHVLDFRFRTMQLTMYGIRHKMPYQYGMIPD